MAFDIVLQDFNFDIVILAHQTTSIRTLDGLRSMKEVKIKEAQKGLHKVLHVDPEGVLATRLSVV